ncbi:MAG TPA: MBL fold metallo-hydrolase [Gaiellaceae bacterium]|nr:MBL fold metallo-hydrolase [Gaiellaceae bacterium]
MTRPDPSGSLRWVGHATVLVELDGVRLLTDPLLRTRVLHLRRAAPLDLGGLDALDAILVSHVHYDHLDPPSLRLLSQETAVVAPRGAAGLLGRIGFRSVAELAAGDEIQVGNVGVRAVPAKHAASRVLGARAESLGYVIEGSQRVYFPGDTDLFPEMAGLATALDVALVPISGWGPRVGPGHLDPRRAAEALALLRPRIAVPIHWGTYYPLTSPGLARPERLAAPAEEFVRAAAELAPAVDVRVLGVGERLPLLA